MDELPFVTAPFSHRPPSATVQMRAREPRKNRQFSGSGEGTASDGSQADFSVKTAKLLTLNITQAFSAPELLGILDRAVGVPFFNEFHASAAYSKLAKWIKHGRLGRRRVGCCHGLLLECKKSLRRVRLSRGQWQTCFGVWGSCLIGWELLSPC